MSVSATKRLARTNTGNLASHQGGVLWRDVSDPPGEATFPIRGTLARGGGVEFWERDDRADEAAWRQREAAHDRWRAHTIAQVRTGQA